MINPMMIWFKELKYIIINGIGNCKLSENYVVDQVSLDNKNHV